jgi:uncharacterized protein with PIN domain
MTDNRCPQCNRPLRGREEILDTRPTKPVDRCPHCGAAVTLRKTDNPGDVVRFYYARAPIIVVDMTLDEWHETRRNRGPLK